MIKKLLFTTLVALLPLAGLCADTELQDIVDEMTDIQGTDIFYVVDDPGGTPNSEKITATNLFDVIDTEAELETISNITNILRESEIDASAELIALMDDETGTGVLVFGTSPTFTTGITSTLVITDLIDTTGAADIDYGSADVTDHTFTTDDCTLTIDGGITVSTGDTITLGATAWNSSDNIDGEVIANDTIDDDSIDFTDVTGVDIDLTDAGAITSTGTITAAVGFDCDGNVDCDMGSADIDDFTFTTDGTGDAEIVLPNDSIGDAEIDWSGLTTSDDLTITGTLIATVGLDTSGAADMDYGSVDVTDHTFVTDGTGTAEIVLPAGSIDGTELLDDTVDSADYAAGSIDAEHLAADIIDETKIADNGIDSEHYNDGSIDAVHIAADVITHTYIADADQADTKCIYIEDPTADDDLTSIWANKTANDFLITEIWGESDQTVTFMLQIDDGTPADVDSVDLAPAAGEAEDTSLDGDTTLAAGEELDLDVASVTNTPTWCSICWTGNWVD